MNTANVETASNLAVYGYKKNALAALRKIVRNNDDLVEQLEDGQWAFDRDAAMAAANLEPENDTRPNMGLQGDTLETPVVGAVTTTTHTEDTAMTREYENVTLDQLKAEDPDLAAKEEAEKKAAAKAAKDAEKAAEKERKAEERAAAKEKRDAEKAELKAKRDADKAEAKAKKEAEKAEASATKEARKAAKDADKQAKADAKAAKAAAKANLDAEREAKKAEKEAAKVAAAEAKEAAKAARAAARADNVKNNIRRPGVNSKCGVLWALIDSMRTDETFPTFQEYLEAAKVYPHEQAGSDVTRTTAYYDYKMFHGVKGRFVAQKAEPQPTDNPDQGTIA